MRPNLQVSDTVDIVLKWNSDMTFTNSHTYFHKSPLSAQSCPKLSILAILYIENG